ncbi:Rv3654c family TadE-like protein [Nocardioides panaciterrulae]|uniref:Secretion/DNA translocation related TadE-like protein n=1 Tax=Nocardioides panaciterrulae TaxID=661492 RepID=A0A7Y9E9W2_9ACTN|nr:secretion/DNA translocation related TadE-like protein [Nocardioides panaciterrulae]
MSLFVVACLGVLLLVGAALGVAGAMVRAHRSAQAAADLAALAVASALGRGEQPCAVGADVAAANGARLVSCRLDGRTARVRVVVAGPHWLGQDADLAAEARAGPAGPPG